MVYNLHLSKLEGKKPKSSVTQKEIHPPELPFTEETSGAQCGVKSSLSASLDHSFVSQTTPYVGGVFLVIPTIQVI